MAKMPILVTATVAAIYAAYEADAETGFRPHLGASLIGNSCARSIWYSWRWGTRAKRAGRLLRLFETGHMAEARFIANLRRIGVDVAEVNPATGKQWSVADDTGHFGGSMDGQGLGIPEAPKTPHVLEFKTHSAKSFKDLATKGVAASKPAHHAQMQVYMHLSGLTRALYLAVNKDTDELYSERVNHDPAEALRLIAKAQRIIKSVNPPERISVDPAWFECKFCDHAAICHGDALPERHCRSCIHSTPISGGEWSCARHDVNLSLEDQHTGCPAHLYIPALVHGEQVDAGEDWVSYAMPDGTEWRDGV